MVFVRYDDVRELRHTESSIWGCLPWHSPYAEHEEEAENDGEPFKPHPLHHSGRTPVNDPLRVRDTLCQRCRKLFDKRDIQGDFCIWCLWDIEEMKAPPAPPERKRRVMLKPADIPLILALRNEGKTYKAIAKRFHVHRKTIGRVLAEHAKLTDETTTGATLAKGA